jgi:hypothetical protein
MTTQELIGLLDFLKRKARAEVLVNDVERIRKRAEPFLAKITETFPEYTIHDIRHSEQVLRILGWLIPLDLLNKMNEYEIFFLIVSCYLHDIGMANLPELLDEDLRQIVDEKKIRIYIRENHHVRSEKFIVNNYNKLGIDDEHQARIIGRICRGHRESLDNRKLYNNREMYTSKSISINVPFLSALLQIADDLDMSFERTPILIYEAFKPKDPLSLQEWKRHLSTCGVGRDPDNVARIIVSAKCRNPNIHRALKRLETVIQAKLDVLPDYLFQYRDYAVSLPHRVLVLIETIGYEAVDLQFRLQEKEVTTLLLGKRLYDRKEAALRELLQNSYDACRLRMKLEPNVKPKIIFQLDADKSRLEVKDNGVGMNTAQIEKYFASIGSCFYKSPDFSEMGVDFTPVSAFGIGILSTFMIADHMIVETKAKDSDPVVIETYTIEDYFLMRPGKRSETGTSIILFLKEEFRKSLDIEKEIEFYARHLEFPIEILRADGTKKRIVPEKKLPSVELFLERKDPKAIRFANSRYSFRSFEVKNPNFEAIFSFLCRKDGGFGLIPPPTWWDRELLRKQNRIYVSYEGIFLNEIDDLLPPYFSSWIYIDVNLYGDIVDLNLSRTAMVKNEKYSKLVCVLEETILDSFRKWISLYEEEHEPSRNLRNAIAMGYIENEVFSDHRYALPKDIKASDALRDFIREDYSFHIYSKERDFFITFSELEETGKKVAILNNSPLSGETHEYTKYLIHNCDAFLPNQFYLLPLYWMREMMDFCNEDSAISTLVKSFASMFAKKTVRTKIETVFPKSWKVVKFKNLKTHNIFEFLSGYGGVGAYVNAENHFIALLIRRPDIITSDSDKNEIVETFFFRLRRDLRSDFNKVVKKQKHILNWYKDAGIIDETKPFVLTKQDIPHNYR